MMNEDFSSELEENNEGEAFVEPEKKPLELNKNYESNKKSRGLIRGGIATLALVALAGGSYFGYNWYMEKDNVKVPAAIEFIDYGSDIKADNLCADFVKSSLRCEVNWTTNENAARGSLLSQSIGKGEEVDPETKVTLTYSSGPAESKFPNLVGQDLEESQETLYEMGIAITETTEVEGDGIPAGRIVSSNVDPGSVVENGTEVTVQVSDGAVEVPDWTGKSKDFVEADAKNYGLNVKFVEETSDKAPGIVLSQDPAAGVVTEDSEITVNVSKVAEIEEVEIPEIIGMKTEEAQSLLAVAGFTNIKIVFVNSSAVDSPQVTEVVPGVAQTASTDSQIVVIVSQPEEASAEEDTTVTDETDVVEEAVETTDEG